MLRFPRARPPFFLLVLALAGTWPLLGQVFAGAAQAALPIPPNGASVEQRFGRLPISFEASGNGDSSFLARGAGYSVQLDSHGAVLRLGSDDVVTMKLNGASPVQPAAQDRLPGTVNYFVGNDPARWRTNLPTYARVAYKEVYPGVDLIYYGNHRALEYDLVVAAQASFKPIRFQFDGARISLEANGDLQIKGQHGVIALHQPVAYQTVGAKKQPVQARFVKTSDTEVAFAVGRYNRNLSLVIDPQIAYSTYFNGAYLAAIAVDSAGSAYVTGVATGQLPVTAGAFQPTYPAYNPDPKASPLTETFVSKLSPNGQSLVYSTYVGGTLRGQGTAIAVDSAGDAYVVGTTASMDFPTTTGVFQPANPHPYGYASVFVFKLNPSGNGLVYSTYLGENDFTNSDTPSAIAVDANGDAYITGSTYSVDFPVTAGAYQKTNKAAVHNASNIFVTKFNPNATALLYSTYLGGSGVAQQGYLFDGLNGLSCPLNRDRTCTYVTNPNPNPPPSNVAETSIGIALDNAGNAYVAANSGSVDYPTTPGAFQPTNPTNLSSRVGPGYAPVVTKLNPTGSALVYSTYLGGSGTLWTNLTNQVSEFGDNLYAIAVDPVTGNAFVAGNAGSLDYPTTAGAFQTTSPGIQSGYFLYRASVVTELNPAGTGVVYSSYLGGKTNPSSAFRLFDDLPTGVATDGNGNVYISGSTYSSDFPVTSGAFEPTFRSQGDFGFPGTSAFFAVLNTGTSQLVYSTYLGGKISDGSVGMAYGAPGNAYLAGSTDSSDFPITPNAFQTTVQGNPHLSDLGYLVYPSASFITKISVGVAGRILTSSALTITSPPANQSAQALLTATVTPLTIAPAEPNLTGTVTFFNNGSPLAPPVPVGNPVTAASLNANLGTGPISLTCSYSGDTYYADSNCALFADFGIVLASPTVTVQTGQHVTTSATIFSIGGFADTISVTCGKVSHLACLPDPSSSPLSANGFVTVSLDLDTASDLATAQNRTSTGSLAQLALLLLPITLLASGRLRRRGSRYALLGCVLALSLGTLALSGCGRIVYPYALPAGTYTFPITATGKTTGDAHTVQLTLIVTP